MWKIRARLAVPGLATVLLVGCGGGGNEDPKTVRVEVTSAEGNVAFTGELGSPLNPADIRVRFEGTTPFTQDFRYALQSRFCVGAMSCVDTYAVRIATASPGPLLTACLTVLELNLRSCETSSQRFFSSRCSHERATHIAVCPPTTQGSR